MFCCRFCFIRSWKFCFIRNLRSETEGSVISCLEYFQNPQIYNAYLPKSVSKFSLFCLQNCLLNAFFMFDFQKDAKGEDVFSFVCKEIDLAEKDYFGLRFVDNNKQRVSLFCVFVYIYDKPTFIHRICMKRQELAPFQ